MTLRHPMLGASLAIAVAACAAQSPVAPPMAHQPAAINRSLPYAVLQHPAETTDESPERWFAAAATTAASHGAATSPARNVILFVGDGMSIPTVAAARILGGQLQGHSGEENLLSFERFPYTALSKTYNTDQQVPDSAGTMSAMATGVKTRAGVIAVDQRAVRDDCASAQGAALRTWIELAEDAGLSTAVISTARLTHATPAATYAHVPERDWENDAELPESAVAAGCQDIAAQLIANRHGNGIDIAMGGGRVNFLPRSETDPEYPSVHGKRHDGRNLISEWQRAHPDGHWIWNLEQFQALASDSGPVFALFEPSHMRFDRERTQDAAGEPSLAEMTRMAIRRLQGSEKGYAMLIEAGRIDHGHHAGNAWRALTDTLALAEAVQVAIDEAGDDTLIVVTADHAHTMSFSGYPARGNPILGLARGADGQPELDGLGLPYTTLGYANGPGYAGASDAQPAGPKHFPHDPKSFTAATGRSDLRNVDPADPDYLQEATLPMSSETHGGDDVAIYAYGPGAQAFHGVLEQNVIAHVLMQAQPALRAQLCAEGGCGAKGIPAQLVR